MKDRPISDTFRTPPKLFKELDSIFNFFWDACCDEDNCLIEGQYEYIDTGRQIRHHETGYNYLVQDMKNIHEDFKEKSNLESIFMNPPYSNPLPFIKKAWEDSKYFRVVMLLKVDPTTEWFNYAINRAIVRPQTEYEGPSGVKVALYDLMHRWKSTYSPHTEIGILYLRKKIKFYVSEEVFQADAGKYPDKVKLKDKNWKDWGDLLETKNYIWQLDGIQSKNTANFPSCIMVFDRRWNEF